MDNPYIQQAHEKLEYLSQDPQVRAAYISRNKYLHDYVTDMEGSREEGKLEGIEIGEKNKNIENALKMLKRGYPVDEISFITNLPIEEIKKLV